MCRSTAMRSFVVAVVIAALTGCGGESHSPEEVAGTGVRASVIIPDGVDRFLAAQGTMCTESGGKFGDCTNSFGPGWPADIPGWCDFDRPTAVCWFTDLGVWDRWLREQGEPGFGTKWRGTVTETALSDGRRRVGVSLHASNAMAIVLSPEGPFGDPAAAEGIYVGAAPAELLEGSRAAALGRLEFAADFILPADYEGYPDMAEFFYREWPAGFEFLSFRHNMQVRDQVRRDIDGLEAGDGAQLSVYMPFNYALAGRLPEHAVARMLRYTFFSPGYHVDLKPVGP